MAFEKLDHAIVSGISNKLRPLIKSDFDLMAVRTSVRIGTIQSTARKIRIAYRSADFAIFFPFPSINDPSLLFLCCKGHVWNDYD